MTSTHPPPARPHLEVRAFGVMSTMTPLSPFELTILRETATWAHGGVARIEAFVDAMHDYGIYDDLERAQWALERRGLLDRGWELTDAGRDVVRTPETP